MGTLIGVPLGVLSAIRPNSATDYILTIFGFLTISTPVFFLGLAGMYIFAVHLHWLPTSGMRTLGVPKSTKDLIEHMILPVTVLTLIHIPLVMRYTRASMIESFRQDYVTTARAKGLTERVVVVGHAFRNALIPLITIIGLSLPELLSGAVITETIFQWPGMGLLAMRAVNARDYPLVLGVILVTAVMVLISNLISDLCYGSPILAFGSNERSSSCRNSARCLVEPDVRWPRVSPPPRVHARHRLALFGAVVIGLLALIAILAPVIAPYDPNEVDLFATSQSPVSRASARHRRHRP